jgi:type 2A phosphatase activator TIP41
MAHRRTRVERVECAGGWTIESTSTPIANRERIEAVERAIGARTTPEMLFESELSLRHAPSGVTVSFNAEDALKGWVELGLPAIKVAVAEAWTRAHVERFGKDEDWSRDVAPANAATPTTTATNASTWNSTENVSDYDWTFTTHYGGSIRADDGARATPSWVPTERRIDRALLTERDPILLYDELTLYESELDDNGIAHLGLKVRVMPKCWYVLLRFWLRVDGVLIRLIETRVFCDVRDASGAPRVLRETQFREETWEQLRARGAPSAPSQYPDPDQAASVLLAAGGPVDIRHDELELAVE